MKAGFIGVGNMGNPMAANMIKAGHRLTVHDLRRESAINLLEMGAEWSDSPAGCVSGNDAVFTSLPVPRDVEAVVMGGERASCPPPAPATFTSICPPTPPPSSAASTTSAPPAASPCWTPRQRRRVRRGRRHPGRHGRRRRGHLQRRQAHARRHRNPRRLLRRNRQRHGHQDLQQPAFHGHRRPHVRGPSPSASRPASPWRPSPTSSPTAAAATVVSPRNSPVTSSPTTSSPASPPPWPPRMVRLATDLGREYGIPMELSNLVDQRHVEALFRGWGPEDSDAVAKLQEEKSGVQLRFGGMGT